MRPTEACNQLSRPHLRILHIGGHGFPPCVWMKAPHGEQNHEPRGHLPPLNFSEDKKRIEWAQVPYKQKEERIIEVLQYLCNINSDSLRWAMAWSVAGNQLGFPGIMTYKSPKHLLFSYLLGEEPAPVTFSNEMRKGAQAGPSALPQHRTPGQWLHHWPKHKDSTKAH